MKLAPAFRDTSVPKTAFPTPDRILILDSLRGIAATSTVLFHFSGQPFFPAFLKSTFSTGFGTSMSFVISGYIIPFVLWKSGYQLNDIWRFLAKRFIRIEPLYLLAIAIVLGGSFINTLSPQYAGPPFALDWVRLLLNVTYLNAIVNAPWIVHIGWILSVELQFYVIIGLVFSAVISPKPFLRLAVWFVFLIAPFCFPLIADQRLALFPGFSHFFVFGMLAFQFRSGIIQKTEFLVLLTLTVLFVTFSLAPSITVIGLVVILPIIFSAKQEPVSAFIGRMSYAIFLFHLPIGFQVTARTTQFLGSANPLNFLILVGSIISGAWILHHVAELPLQRVAQRVQYGKYRRLKSAAGEPSGEPDVASKKTGGFTLVET